MKYREFNCIVCGAKAIDRSPAQNRIYCSDQCNLVHFRRSRGIGIGIKTASCTYNKEIKCEIHKCSTCGWNPEVAQKRKEAFAYG